jgi:hypothetical protein
LNAELCSTFIPATLEFDSPRDRGWLVIKIIKQCFVCLWTDFNLNAELCSMFIPTTLEFDSQGTEDGRCLLNVFCISRFYPNTK